MKRRMFNLTLVGVFLVGAVGSGTRAPADASVEGQWDAVLDWPLQAIHMILLKNGKVLAFDETQDANPTNACMVFDPVTGNVTTFDGPANPLHDLFCSGHAALANGKIMFTGGGDLGPHTTLYDPDVDPPGPESWITQDLGTADRFYPTCTTLGDGTVLTMAGHFQPPFGPPETDANIPAIFNHNPPVGVSQWTALTGAEFCTTDLNCAVNNFHLHWYPFMFLLSNAKVIYGGSDDAAGELTSSPGTRTLDTASQAWADVVDESGVPINDPIRGGSAVMYYPNVIMKAGGRDDDDNVLASVYAINATATYPTWVSLTPMAHARRNHYLVVLAGGTVLAVGGRNAGGNVLDPELYYPTTNTWSAMALMDSPGREYHSSALLLPDARVLVAGGDPHDTENATSAQVFSPPYLFGPCLPDETACARPVRPVIEGVPNVICYRSDFQVTSSDAPDITKVALIRLGSATHSFDFDQRFAELQFQFNPADPLTLSVTPPEWPNDAPPGYYMLFILVDRLPSKAAIVKLSAGDTDCNGNGVPDECDIANGTSQDLNGNMVPDECETPPPVGGCCMGDSTCQILSEASCTGAGGSFLHPGTDCEPFGACCLAPGGCIDTSESCCDAVGGLFRPNQTCPPLPFGCFPQSGPQPG